MAMSGKIASYLILAINFFQGAVALDCLVQSTTVCDNWACIDTATLTSTTCGGVNPKCNLIRTYDATGATEKYETETQCADTTSSGFECWFTSSCDVTCNKYCSTTDCNDVYTVASGTTTATNCVQCTSEDDSGGSCYSSPPTETACPSTAHQYCTLLHTVVLGADGLKDHDVVFRGCAATDFADGCWVDHTQVDSNSGTMGTSVTCSKTCSTAGCNSEALPMSSVKGSGIFCQSCYSEHGACGSIVSQACQAGMEYCYSKVIYTDGDYYHATNDADAEAYEVQVIYEERGCRAAPLTNGGSCQTINTDIGGSNIDVISCDETCVGDNCNDNWPQRPKCLQCSGAYWNAGAVVASGGVGSWDTCALHPPAGKQCPDPSYKFCYALQKYVPDGDNEITWGYAKEFTRGCLKDRQVSHCFDRSFRDEKEAHICQHICTTDDCNQGSNATGLSVSLTALVVSLLATRLS